MASTRPFREAPATNVRCGTAISSSRTASPIHAWRSSRADGSSASGLCRARTVRWRWERSCTSGGGVKRGARGSTGGRSRLYRCILSIMKIVKVRRVGNSNVISLPRELEAQGYVPGASVLVEQLPDGELRVMSTEKVRERIREVGERLVGEHGEALAILANHAPDAPKR